MQADGFTGFQIDDRRARVAPERRAIVLQLVGSDVGHLAGREALLLVDVAEDSLDQPLIRHAWIAGGVADGDDEVVRRHRLGQWNRRRQATSRRRALDAQVGDVRLVRRGDPEDRFDREFEAGAAIELLEEVDVRGLRPAVDADAEDESRGAAAAELARDVPVGHDDVVGHQPAGADPAEVRVVLELHAADRRNHDIENGPCAVDARGPRFTVRSEEFRGDSIAADREHRPRARADDRFRHPALVGGDLGIEGSGVAMLTSPRSAGRRGWNSSRISAALRAIGNTASSSVGSAALRRNSRYNSGSRFSNRSTD